MTDKKGMGLIEYIVLVVVIISMIAGMAVYVKRSLSGKWREVGDTFGFGRQYEPGSGISRSGGAAVPENDIYGNSTLVIIGVDVDLGGATFPENPDSMGPIITATEEIIDSITSWPIVENSDAIGSPIQEDIYGPDQFTPERPDSYSAGEPTQMADTAGDRVNAEAKDICSGATDCWQDITPIQVNNFLGTGPSPPTDTCNGDNSTSYTCVAENPGCTDVYPGGSGYEWRWVTCSVELPVDNCPGNDSSSLYSCNPGDDFACQDVAGSQYRIVICAVGYRAGDYVDTCDLSVSTKSYLNVVPAEPTGCTETSANGCTGCNTFDDNRSSTMLNPSDPDGPYILGGCTDVWEEGSGDTYRAYYRNITCVGGYEPLTVTETVANACPHNIGDPYPNPSPNPTERSYLSISGCQTNDNFSCKDIWEETIIYNGANYTKQDYQDITCVGGYEAITDNCPDIIGDPFPNPSPDPDTRSYLGTSGCETSDSFTCTDTWLDINTRPHNQSFTCRTILDIPADNCDYDSTTQCQISIDGRCPLNDGSSYVDVWESGGQVYYRDIQCYAGYNIWVNNSTDCNFDITTEAGYDPERDGYCRAWDSVNCTDAWNQSSGLCAPGSPVSNGICMVTFLCNAGYVIPVDNSTDCNNNTALPSPDLSRLLSDGLCNTDSAFTCTDAWIAGSVQYYRTITCNRGYTVTEADTCNGDTGGSFACPPAADNICRDVVDDAYYRDIDCNPDSSFDTCGDGYAQYTCPEINLFCTDVYTSGGPVWTRDVTCIPDQDLTNYSDTCGGFDNQNQFGCQVPGPSPCRDVYLSGLYYYSTVQCTTASGTIICDNDPNTSYPDMSYCQ